MKLGAIRDEDEDGDDGDFQRPMPGHLYKLVRSLARPFREHSFIYFFDSAASA